MYVITNKRNEIISSGSACEIFPINGNYIVDGIQFIKDEVNVNEVESIPNYCEEFKYCYTEEKGFYPNPNYHEPTVYDRVNPSDVLEIEANYTSQLIKEGVI